MQVWAWWKLYGWCKATVIMYTEETTREGTERTHLLLFDDGEDEAVREHRTNVIRDFCFLVSRHCFRLS